MRNMFADHLANIAHQLKTPLTALSLQVQAADGACRRACHGWQNPCCCWRALTPARCRYARRRPTCSPC